MEPTVDRLIEAALAEDIGTGDLTSRYFVPEDRRISGHIVARESGVLSGVKIAAEVFQKIDPSLEINVLLEDGVQVGADAIVIQLKGSARSILTGERTALNFIQRLSGIATATRKYVEAIRSTEAQILDTRKTLPGWRFLDKQAVVHGGGTNHRMGLYDRVMVKDNHLVAQDQLEQLQASINLLLVDHPEVEVELEADSLEQVTAFLKLTGVDHILLDNMSLSDLREAVEMRGPRGRPQLEASGGVNLNTVRAIAETGVDFISVGAITHSVTALDLAMDFVDAPA